MKVDMDLLKSLRETTQAPLKDCKDALIEAEGDFDKALIVLKQKGLSKAAKKADRETNEWVVMVKKIWNIIVWIKLACETDFAAKNEWFINLWNSILNILEKYWKPFQNIDGLDNSVLENQINPTIAESIWSIWENMKLLDAFIKEWNAYVYNHMDMNKLVSVVFYEWWDESVAKELALQIAAMNPKYKSIEDISVEDRNSLKEKFKKEMEWSNKPADIIDKILEWKLSKEYEDFVLFEQIYIRDDSKKIKHIIPNGFVLKEYIRFAI